MEKKAKKIVKRTVTDGMESKRFSIVRYSGSVISAIPCKVQNIPGCLASYIVYYPSPDLMMYISQTPAATSDLTRSEFRPAYLTSL
ncbi:hypothetical protein RRG08_044739 [Elysia crispata]|uniref:Uncharacterized protein n=1 Tax=Elysia crispata TaxID=231223 RepID=A0AAE1DG84_9GAST|nr:hypothetical protein RRG08_044739 [Elysia crispata]